MGFLIHFLINLGILLISNDTKSDIIAAFLFACFIRSLEIMNF